MKYILLAAACCWISTITAQKRYTISQDALKDKIMGGWAGQTIGVTYGGPYEFQFNGTFIQDYQPLPWDGSTLKTNMLHNPGLYDDLYMDLTFVDVFEKYGLNAPVDSFANAFANAGYFLWHANQAARYNILHGIKAPQSGQWQHNPHAEDIDYQIEADYAGLMSPGMPNTASAISDKIGHIMNYGDGWYGGVYIGALYSLAFLHQDINYVVTEALKVIPAASTYYQCINDVINWHRQYPNDWHRTWYEIQQKWSGDIACHDGIFNAFNIDAKINSAYVVLGLLYGKGDFGRSLEIATRAGQDADCNPSSVGGILGTILGYKNIPARWKQGLTDIEDIPFKYTDISLNKAYAIGLGHALKNVQANGGFVKGDQVEILAQTPKAVPLEQGFADNYPVSRTGWYKTLGEAAFDFEGTGFSLAGSAQKKQKESPEYVFEVAVYIDGQQAEIVKLPTDFVKRRLEICWKYQLPTAKHTVRLQVLNPHEGYELKTTSYIVFSHQRPK